MGQVSAIGRGRRDPVLDKDNGLDDYLKLFLALILSGGCCFLNQNLLLFFLGSEVITDAGILYCCLQLFP